MKILLFNFCLFIIVNLSTQNATANEGIETCDQIIQKTSRPTTDFWAFIKTLLDEKVLFTTDLELFYQELKNGHLINPIQHNMTSYGPVFKSASDLATYKQLQKFIDYQNSNHKYIDLKKIEELASGHFNKIKNNQTQRISVKDTSNIDFFENEFFKNFIHLTWMREEFETNRLESELKHFENLMIKHFPTKMEDLALTFLKEDKIGISTRILKKLNKLEEKSELYLHDRDKARYLLEQIGPIEELSNPVVFAEKNFNNPNLVTFTDQAIIDRFLSMLSNSNLDNNMMPFLEQNKSRFLTNDFTAKKFMEAYFRIPKNKSLQIIKNVLYKYPKFSEIALATLATKSSYEAHKLKVQIFSKALINFKILLLENFNSKNSSQAEEMFNLAMETKDWQVIRAASRLLSQMDDVIAAQKAKYALKVTNDPYTHSSIFEALSKNKSDSAIDLLINTHINLQNSPSTSSHATIQSSELASILFQSESPRAYKFVLSGITKSLKTNDHLFFDNVFYLPNHHIPNELIISIIKKWNFDQVSPALLHLISKYQDKKIFDFLVKTLHHHRNGVPKTAAKAISSYPIEISLPIMKDLAVNHPEQEVRILALGTFLEISDPEIDQIILKKILNGNKDNESRLALFIYFYKSQLNIKQDELEKKIKTIRDYSQKFLGDTP